MAVLLALSDPTQPSVFDSNTVEITVKDLFGQQIPAKRIFVRQCYKVLLGAVWSIFQRREISTIMVTGTPGIGKSLFGLLFLVELIRTVLTTGEDNLALLGPGLSGRIVYEYVGVPGDPATYFLIDVPAKTVETTCERPLDWVFDMHVFLIKDGPCTVYPVECSVLWISSPRAGSFQKASGKLGVVEFILPPWDGDELVECWKANCTPPDLFKVPPMQASAKARKAMEDVEVEAKEDGLSDFEKDEAILRRWAADLGPVARRVFGPSKAYRMLDGALHDIGDEDLGKLVELAASSDTSAASSKFKNSHRLLLMIPGDDFTTYTFIPSSVQIGRRVLTKLLKGQVKEAESLIGQLKGTNKGLVFEPYAHHRLTTGDTFELRNLDTNDTSELTLTAQETKNVTNVDLEDLVLQNDCYYVPTDPTFAVVDSWTQEDMFQMTVGLVHPMKSGSRQYKALKNKGPRRIIFVVPKELALSFPKQPLVLASGKPAGEGGPKGGWNDVPQFVLGL
jgi:hypothetical protein